MISYQLDKDQHQSQSRQHRPLTDISPRNQSGTKCSAKGVSNILVIMLDIQIGKIPLKTGSKLEKCLTLPLLWVGIQTERLNLIVTNCEAREERLLYFCPQRPEGAF